MRKRKTNHVMIFLENFPKQSESDLLKFRNFGKKSLNEIKSKLKEMKLFLGMQNELIKYNIDKNNIKDVIESYQKEMKSHET